MSRLRPLLPLPILAAFALAAPALPGVAGTAALYPMLGVAPGMALALLLTGPRGPCWTLGLALSPLVAAAAAAALIGAGVPLGIAARGVAIAGAALWALLALRRSLQREPRPAADPAPDLRVLLVIALGAAVLTSVPWLANVWIRVRSDSWIHGGLVQEILHHGLPPEDPRFAGLQLNYVWFFDLFIALQTRLTGRDMFVHMMLFNAVNLGVCIALVYRFALELWRNRAAAAGAALLVPLGLNAGAWVLWPLGVARALVGRTRGWPEVVRYARAVHWKDSDVMLSLGAPFAYIVNVIDKFLVGTALSYGWVLMLVYLWALLRWLERGERAALAWAVAGASGMLFFHGVVGMSVIPVMLGTLALAALVPPFARAPRSRLAAFAAATAVGALVALPYTRSITAGWSTAKSGVHHHYFHLGWGMLWTLVTSLAVTGALAARPLLRLLRQRSPAGVLLAIYTLAMAAFAVVVHLPLENESKFAAQVFFPLAIFAGPALLPFARGTLRRLGPGAGGVALFLLFLFAPAVLLVDYTIDPGWKTEQAVVPRGGAAEEALYTWIRAHVEPDGFLTDRGGRNLLMVKGERRLWVGTRDSSDKAAFPAPELAHRRAVEADLYGRADSLAADVRALESLGRPAYVLVRPEDSPPGDPDPAIRFETRPDFFTRVYDAAGFRVYRLRRLP